MFSGTVTGNPAVLVSSAVTVNQEIPVVTSLPSNSSAFTYQPGYELDGITKNVRA